MLVSACGPGAEGPGATGGHADVREVRSIDPPAGTGALAPNLASSNGGLLLSWLEPHGQSPEAGHRLLFSRLSDSRWSEPVTIAEGTGFFANWADLPAAVETGGGDLLAHWLAKTGEETYAYSIFLARSGDGGSSWRAAGKLNRDVTDTEHGFVSWLSDQEGARGFWLDGREMATGGAMTLRTAVVGRSIGTDVVLDRMTCECCATDAATTAGGSVVVYRDRSEGEIRDVAIVREVDGGWTEPRLVHPDGWHIEGCPVNGPAVAAQGSRVVVAWYTEAHDEPVVKVAWSADAGRTFDAVETVDDVTPLGRVDVALDEAGRAWIVWMRRIGAEAEILLRQLGPGGPGETVRLATTSASRSSGFPKIVAQADRLAVVWTEVVESAPRRLRLVEVRP
jgi:hypothetical protein